MKTKLLTARADIEERRLARQKVAGTVEGYIADLHTSIATNTPKKSDNSSDARLTDLLNTRKQVVWKKRRATANLYAHCQQPLGGPTPISTWNPQMPTLTRLFPLLTTELAATHKCVMAMAVTLFHT